MKITSIKKADSYQINLRYKNTHDIFTKKSATTASNNTF